MSDLIDVVQLQEIDDSFIELFDITLPSGTTVYLFNGLQDNLNNVTFTDSSSTLNEYWAIPIEMDGVEKNSTGTPSRPALTIANLPVLTKNAVPETLIAPGDPGNSGEAPDGVQDETTLDSIARAETLGVLASEGIYKNEDFIGSTVLYRSTLKSKLNTPGAPVEFPPSKFIIDRVENENSILVTFELASPYDLEGVQIPNRQVTGRYCAWEYQGTKTRGSGGCIWDLDSRGRFYDINDNSIALPAVWNSGLSYSTGSRVYTITPVPSGGNITRIWEAIRPSPVGVNPVESRYYWKRIDVCSKTLSGCKKRFQDAGTANEDTSVPLPFGGFPGTRKFR